MGAQLPAGDRVVLRHGGKLLQVASVGGAAGLVGAAWLSRLLEGILYGVEPGDPITFLGAGAAMLGVALLAAFLPARRALELDPAEALRAE